MSTGMTGRRERNKAEKRERITAAAAALFARHGFGRTTTGQVAADADVAEGTVFRYAGTKTELLLMVLNEQLEPLLRIGGERARAATSPEDAIIAVFAPILDLFDRQNENAALFMREVLFGDDGPHRRAALALIDELVAEIAGILAPLEPGLPEELDLDEAAHWVFSALVTEVMREVLDRDAAADRQRILGARVRILLKGLT